MQICNRELQGSSLRACRGRSRLTLLWRSSYTRHESGFVPLRWLSGRNGSAQHTHDVQVLVREDHMGPRVGVEAVYGGGACTYSEPERFFSFRRDGETGRMATLIWMEAGPG